MGSKKLRNHGYVGKGPNMPAPVVPGFEKIDQLADAIEAPFLKARVHAYVEAARDLADALDYLSSPDADPAALRDDIAYSFKAFAKSARLVDFILSVSGASRYQSEGGRQIACTICQAVEPRLAPHITKQENGTTRLTRPQNLALIETIHSKSGRWIGKQFARVVPQAA